MKNYSWILFLIIIIQFIIIIVFWLRPEKNKYIVEDRVLYDTLYVQRVIRDTIPKLVYIKEKEIIIDTLLTVDSIQVPVYIPIEEKQYTNTFIQDRDTISYNLKLSGFKAKLEDININVSYPLIKETKFIREPEKWSDRFSLGIGVYGGYGIINKQPDIFIGVGLNYKLK